MNVATFYQFVHLEALDEVRARLQDLVEVLAL